jgi:hypothetical protein
MQQDAQMVDGGETGGKPAMSPGGQGGQAGGERVNPDAARAGRGLAWGFAGLLVFLPILVMVLNRNELKKDYPKWYDAGQELLHRQPLYVPGRDGTFDFMYPPAAAALLAPLTRLGPWGMVAALAVLNSLCWWASVWLGVWLVRGGGIRPAKEHEGADGESKQEQARGTLLPRAGTWGYVLLYAVPVLCTVAYCWDTYILGQVSVVLLICMVGAFACLRKGWQWSAGALVALAAAIKAFPIAAIVYLLWRRQWRAVISTVVVTVLLLVALPAVFVGWTQSARQLSKWADGMVFQYDAHGIGQRPTRGFSWKNQSIFGVGHRLLRHVDANMKPGAGRTMFVNVVDWPFGAVTGAIVAGVAALGLFYLWAMPPGPQRTGRTDCLEWGMLLVLILMLSPFSFGYFNVWLLFPFAAGVGVWLSWPEGSRGRRGLAVAMGVALVLYVTGLPMVKAFHGLQAVGTIFWGHLVVLATLGWALRREWKGKPRGGVTEC